MVRAINSASVVREWSNCVCGIRKGLSWDPVDDGKFIGRYGEEEHPGKENSVVKGTRVGTIKSALKFCTVATTGGLCGRREDGGMAAR